MEAVITFRATRDAINGERAVLEAGLAAKVMALPSALGAGCGLCLRLKAGELELGSQALASAGIEPEGLYYKYKEEGRTVYRPVHKNPI